ncbi:hypothetical protein MTR_3g008080 [Medicago truncatula]|uniref:Uncharacterized protein n=1 Tax=Medicago truncatula TaxID=3880 RepID=G7IVK3_MEDTR|nr:hypothetical protein MTR_3g008080 [Medicago truncatula]
MEEVFIQQECAQALKGEVVLSITVSQAENAKMVDKVRSVIVLCLRGKVLRIVVKETITSAI